MPVRGKPLPIHETETGQHHLLLRHPQHPPQPQVTKTETIEATEVEGTKAHNVPNIKKTTLQTPFQLQPHPQDDDDLIQQSPYDKSLPLEDTVDDKDWPKGNKVETIETTEYEENLATDSDTAQSKQGEQPWTFERQTRDLTDGGTKATAKDNLTVETEPSNEALTKQYGDRQKLHPPVTQRGPPPLMSNETPLDGPPTTRQSPRRAIQTQNPSPE